MTNEKNRKLQLYEVFVFNPHGAEYQDVWRAIVLAADEKEAKSIVRAFNDGRIKEDEMMVKKVKLKPGVLTATNTHANIPRRLLANTRKILKEVEVPRD